MKRSIYSLMILLLLSLTRLSAQPTCLMSNIAAGQPVASSRYDDGAVNVVDGNNTTFWYPETDGDQWIYVDLGQNYTLCKVVLLWNEWKGQDTFKVQFSTDTTHWTDLAYNTAEPVSGPTGSNYQMTTVDLSTNTMSGRYLRIYLYNVSGWSVLMQELQVYPKLPLSVPSVSLTAPADGANYTEGDSVVLQATATDSGGTISQVQYYQGTTLLGSSTTSPYTFTWKQVPEGEYVVTAKATDIYGYSAASSSINVYVDYPLPAWSMTGNKGTNGDSNFLGTIDSTKLVFRTKNLKRMTILPGGNIGIGVDSPTAQLHTTGSVRLAGLTIDSTKTRVLVSDSAGNLAYRSLSNLSGGTALQQGGNSYGTPVSVGTKDNNPLDFYTDSVRRGRWATTGNLLIGTTADDSVDVLQTAGSILVDLPDSNGQTTLATYSHNRYNNWQEIHNDNPYAGTMSGIRFYTASGLITQIFSGNTANAFAHSGMVFHDIAGGGFDFVSPASTGFISWGNNFKVQGGSKMIFYPTSGNLLIGSTTDNGSRLQVTGNGYFTGNVGIGTASPQSPLAVNGTITAKKVVVTQSGWADYVFRRNYRLPALPEVERYIARHQHLPGVVSAAEVANKGVDLGDNQVVLLRKIEELTLYLIEQNKELEALKSENQKLTSLQQQIDELKKMIQSKNQ